MKRTPIGLLGWLYRLRNRLADEAWQRRHVWMSYEWTRHQNRASVQADASRPWRHLRGRYR